jgi:hypothetical protein
VKGTAARRGNTQLATGELAFEVARQSKHSSQAAFLDSVFALPVSSMPTTNTGMMQRALMQLPSSLVASGIVLEKDQVG